MIVMTARYKPDSDPNPDPDPDPNSRYWLGDVSSGAIHAGINCNRGNVGRERGWNPTKR